MSEERKNQADANDGLDNLFRSTLESHQIEPSRNLWKGISRKLLRAEISRFNFINLPKSYWIGAAGVILVGIVFLLNRTPEGKIIVNDSPSVAKTETEGNHPLASSKVHTLTESNNSSAVRENPSSKDTRINLQEQDRKTRTSSTKTVSPALASNSSIRSNTKSGTGITSIVTAGNEFSSNSSVESQKSEDRLINSQDRIINNNELKYLPFINSGILFPSVTTDTLLRITNMDGITNIPVKTKLEIPHFYSLNLGVSPELSIYNSSDQYSEANYWLNAGMTYHFGKFSVQASVGLGYVFDKGNYRVNYKSKDSIGYFTSIISFIVTPGNVIVYTTKDIAVYDSLQHIADDRAISRYTYLQIPLLLGYELFETNRFSLGIKAGPVLSFLIATKEAAPFIDYPNARLIRVDNNSLSRVKMNWEIQAVLDLDYRLTKNFSVYAQPYYKHYFKPFVTGESTSVQVKDPYAIGIEIGARFNFGQKSIKP